MVNVYKQVIVVRKDLKLGKGKIASQAAHASIGSMKAADKETVKEWELEGSKKVVLKVENLKELDDLKKDVKKEKIPYFIVRDAGLTQTESGTVTCMGIGPEREDKIDRLTKNLKLL